MWASVRAAVRSYVASPLKQWEEMSEECMSVGQTATHRSNSPLCVKGFQVRLLIPIPFRDGAGHRRLGHAGVAHVRLCSRVVVFGGAGEEELSKEFTGKLVECAIDSIPLVS